eukprot:Lithocolla_globosa_v1_NODE_195_length_5267_cov_27.182464.p4 type:complete len:132 gc:universal NODE_195_length_5267_cov_27.182464:613-1008(+)
MLDGVVGCGPLKQKFSPVRSPGSSVSLQGHADGSDKPLGRRLAGRLSRMAKDLGYSLMLEHFLDDSSEFTSVVTRQRSRFHLQEHRLQSIPNRLGISIAQQRHSSKFGPQIHNDENGDCAKVHHVHLPDAV